VTESLKQRLQAKITKRYGPNTVLVVRDTSGVDWDWDLVVGEIKTSFSDRLTRSTVESGFSTGQRIGSSTFFER
jgi:hypothetical protein